MDALQELAVVVAVKLSNDHRLGLSLRSLSLQYIIILTL